MASAIPHLFFVFLLSCFSSSAQTNSGKVTVGSSITAAEDPSYWLSSSEDFAFGFQNLPGQDLFLLCIWYNKISTKTIVWSTNNGNPVPKGSKVELTSDHGLVLVVPENDKTNISGTVAGDVGYAVMNDTGNFMVMSTNSESLWESFNHPTDTLLPTQTMVNQSLNSSQSETNFSQGRFNLGFSNGHLVLRTRNVPSEFLNPHYLDLGVGTKMQFDDSGYIYILNNTGQKVALFGQENTVGGFYYRAILHFDGVFAVYRYAKSDFLNENWSQVWAVPDNICLPVVESAGSGVCGYNRICSLGPDKRPNCKCPEAFATLGSDDNYRNCIPNFVLDCQGPDYNENDYELEQATDVDWPTSDYDLLMPSTEGSCRTACLQDCMCTVAIFRDNQCWKKKIPLSNGRYNPTMNSLVLMKKKKSNATQSLTPVVQIHKDRNGLIILISALLGASAFINFIFVGVISLGCLLIYHRKLARTRRGDNAAERHLHCFTYKELAAATNGFKEELGRGSFGIVYKGEVKLGFKVPVAVKKLDRIVQDGDKEFRTEVNVIGQTHHKNLVKLVGYCDEGPHRALVYEFMSNGTLAGFLFGGDMKLSWKQRSQIAVGIARGLLYLHDECIIQTIHCDIKPQNILLDDNFDARISDFGLAKLLRMDQSETHTAIRGTKGYVAPEWFRNMPITVKTDVYSFGVLLLEIICCRRNVDMEVGEEKSILAYWAYDCFVEGNLDALLENDEDISDRKKLERFLMVAIWCIQEDPFLRPTMKKVLLMLEGIIEVTPPPCPYPFSTLGRSDDAV